MFNFMHKNCNKLLRDKFNDCRLNNLAFSNKIAFLTIWFYIDFFLLSKKNAATLPVEWFDVWSVQENAYSLWKQQSLRPLHHE